MSGQRKKGHYIADDCEGGLFKNAFLFIFTGVRLTCTVLINAAKPSVFYITMNKPVAHKLRVLCHCGKCTETTHTLLTCKGRDFLQGPVPGPDRGEREEEKLRKG